MLDRDQRLAQVAQIAVTRAILQAPEAESAKSSG